MNKIIKSVEIYSKAILELLTLFKYLDLKYDITTTKNSILITLEKKNFAWKITDTKEPATKELQSNEIISIAIAYKKEVY